MVRGWRCWRRYRETRGSKSRLVARDLPRVEFDTVRGREPNVFRIQATRMPVDVERPG